MAHGVGCNTLQIGQCEVVEVLFRQEHVGALVIDVEEVLQVREAVGFADLFDVLERNVGLVAACDGKHLLGLEAALKMQM